MCDNFFKSSEDEALVSRIEEEYVDQLCSMNMNEKKRLTRISNPIHIGGHHTVSGHEALNLAKRLSEELATQGSSSASSQVPIKARAISPEVEPISRSFEGKKGNFID
jgi:hypothetical protein